MAVSKHPVLSRSNERVRICDGQTLIYAALFSRHAFKGTFRARIYYTRDDWQDIKKPFQSYVLEWKISISLAYIPAGFLADYIRHCPLAMQCLMHPNKAQWPLLHLK